MKGEEAWERFARRAPEQYILTGIGRGPGPARIEEFFESGRRDAAWIIDEVGGVLPGCDLAVEIGCGVGRLLIPMASRFRRVVGVDVAPTMLARLTENCSTYGAGNVKPALAGEPWEESLQADFIYSWLVFQHVADAGVIETLLRKVASALKPGGAALLQFDTRPRTPLYHLRNALPDALLPWAWRRGIRRIRRAPGDIDRMLHAAGLRALRQHGQDSARHIVIAARAATPQP